ncbi:MAG: IS3 family transposase [Elusimicrobia bacterium]|nr:IS3 family transposase [Elusimicrobiota bacterium]
MSVERSLAKLLGEKGLSERRACRVLNAKRSSIRNAAKPESELNAKLRVELKSLSQDYSFYGTPRASAVMWDRYGVNHKRVERLRVEEGLPLPRKLKHYRPSTEPWERPAEGTRPNEVWSLDFVHHRTEHGQELKMLTVIDEYSRECLEIRVEKQMKHDVVMETLDELMNERGAPVYLRSDNGAEFIAAALQEWLRAKGVKAIFIEPGHPWQNGYIESFNGKFRAECLDRELFYSRAEAQIIVDRYREFYNTERPHSALGYRAPLEVLAWQQRKIATIRNDFPGGRKEG